MTESTECNSCQSKYLSWVPELNDDMNGYWLCNKCGKRNEHAWFYKDGSVFPNPKLEGTSN